MTEKNLINQGGQTAGELIKDGNVVQQLATRFATAVAVQKPRDLKNVLTACIAEAEISGDLFYYRWRVKTKDGQNTSIQGASVKLALAAVRNFGNMAVQQLPVQETRDAYIFTTAVVDIETGFTYERQFRMSKDYPIYGKHDKYRKDDIRFQIGQSKATRNAVLNAVPAGVVDKMLNAAFDSVRGIIEKRIEQAGGEISKVIDQMLIAFAKFDITQDMIEDKIGLKADKWDIEILTLLAGDLKAIQTGSETAYTLYGKDELEDELPAEKKVDMGEMAPGDPGKHQDVKDGKTAAEKEEEF